MRAGRKSSRLWPHAHVNGHRTDGLFPDNASHAPSCLESAGEPNRLRLRLRESPLREKTAELLPTSTTLLRRHLFSRKGIRLASGGGNRTRGSCSMGSRKETSGDGDDQHAVPRDRRVCMADLEHPRHGWVAKPVHNSRWIARRDVMGGFPENIRCRFHRLESARRWRGQEKGAMTVGKSVDQMEVPGPQLPAETANRPVRCASAPAANAAVSSCLT